MIDDVNLRAWLRLTSVPGIGRETQRQLLKVFGLPEAIFSAGLPGIRLQAVGLEAQSQN